jgi:signal transduction histidine kinase
VVGGGTGAAEVRAPRLAFGLRTRLCHLSVAVVCATAAALGALIDRGVAATIRSSRDATLDRAQPRLAAAAAALLERRDDEALDRMVRALVDGEPFELAACYDLAGRARAVASRRPLTADQTLALQQYGRGNSLHALQRSWEPSRLAFLPNPAIGSAGGSAAAPRGVLLLATDPTRLEARLASLSRMLWTAAGVGGAAAVVALLLLARALARPLLALVDDVKRLEQGQPAAQLATEGGDEVGALARDFGEMAREIETSRLALQQEGARLEQAVEQRKETLGKALRELKQLGRRKDALLSSISHEFRTPLTVMQSSAEILANDADPAALAEFLPGLRQHALALDRLVDNLLCMLDLERCERVAAPVSAPLGKLVDAALAQVEPERIRRDAAVVAELQRELTVRWDVPLVTRLLRELLLNALQFSPKGGMVTISMARTGGRLRLAVADEGPGIPAEQREEVFERFHQLGDVMTSKPQGAGLGLPIARAIAVLHGGWVRVDAAGERGAKFVVEMPVDAGSGSFQNETPEWVLQELRP